MGSGVVNVLSVMHPHFPPHGALFEEVFPLEFFHISRFLTLLIGLALVVASLYLLKRKQRALLAAFSLTCIAVPFHLAQGLDYRGAIFSCLLLFVLLVARGNFTVRSETPDIRSGLTALPIAVLIAFAYGVAGFWLLDRRQFGINFNIIDSVRRTIRFLTLVGDPEIVPKTRFARWFIDSLYLTTAAALAYSFYSIYRPVIFRLRTLPRERSQAAAIVAQHGRSALDFFKHWVDKSYFFSPERTAFLAYRVGGRYAIVLGDPVGPEETIEPLVREFKLHCMQNDWGLAFHQVPPDLLPLYARLGFRRLKIGDDAIVDIAGFTLEGRHSKEFRNTIARLEKIGVRARMIEPPVPDEIIESIRIVSDEWLTLPGRRERQFTLGLFDPAYVRSTRLVVGRGRRRKGPGIPESDPVRSLGRGDDRLDATPPGDTERHHGLPLREALSRVEGGGIRAVQPGNGADGRISRARRSHGRGAGDPLLLPAAELPLQLQRTPRLQGQVRHIVGTALSDLSASARSAGRRDRAREGFGAAPIEGARWNRFRVESTNGAGSGAARRWLQQGIGYLLALACLIWIFHGVSPRDLWRDMRGIRWSWVLPAILLDILSYFCQGIRWGLLLGPPRSVSPVKTTQAIYAGLFTNEIFPMRLGEVVRAYLVSRWMSIDIARIIPSMAVERLFDGVWLVLAIGIAAIFVPLPKDLTRAGDILGAVLLVAGILFLLLVVRRRRVAKPARGRFARASPPDRR